ncbi:MAG: fatty acid desaturase [Deltaproteobacteria bacterium]|nr:fatty acid desaturase [Deltaproteobacteria bacterium]
MAETATLANGAGAAVLDPSEVAAGDARRWLAHLSPDEIRELRRLDDVRGWASVLTNWGLVGAAMALVAAFPNPLTVVIALAVIGTRQLGCAILMHEAAHRTLFSSRALNDWVGNWLCAYPVWGDLVPYRRYHLQHHAKNWTAEAPDLALAAPFPVTRASMRRKILRDLTGRTAAKRVLYTIARHAGRVPDLTGGAVAPRRESLIGMAVTNAVLLGAGDGRPSGALSLVGGCVVHHAPPGDPAALDRRARDGAGSHRSHAEHPHHAREPARAPARRAQLRELPPRAPPGDDRAALPPAAHAPDAPRARCPRRRVRRARLRACATPRRQQALSGLRGAEGCPPQSCRSRARRAPCLCGNRTIDTVNRSEIRRRRWTRTPFAPARDFSPMNSMWRARRRGSARWDRVVWRAPCDRSPSQCGAESGGCRAERSEAGEWRVLPSSRRAPPQAIPESHLASIILDAVERLGASEAALAEREPPRVMQPLATVDDRRLTAVLVYWYSHGVLSTRVIEGATAADSVAAFLAGRPRSHEEIRQFRRTHRVALVNVFVDVYQRCQRRGS